MVLRAAGVFLNIVVNIDIALMVHHQFVNFQQELANNRVRAAGDQHFVTLAEQANIPERTLLKASHRFFSLIRRTKSSF